ncbi:MAG: hypothetical protein IKP86_13790 [Anaerolineaceae bacterium]|nr:hypothetical protein [Anaerolineaceae bacterium]
MTDNLAQLKQIIPVLAAAAGIAVFVLILILADLLLDEIISRRNAKGIRTEDAFMPEMDDVLRYDRIIRKENARCTWMIKAAGVLSLALLAAAAVFHSILLEKTGPEMFSAIILILSVSAAFFILQDKRWRTDAAEDLIHYSFLFAAAAPDTHTGIRMMLLDRDTDFPLKALLLEIQKDNPGISGKDLMKTAGKILKSDAMIRAFSDKQEDMTGTEGEKNHFSRTDLYSSATVFLSFGIMIILCFLL